MTTIPQETKLPVAVASWVKTETRPDVPSTQLNSLSLVDSFCGCGGLSLGVWEALRHANRHLDIRLAIDSAEEPIKVYRKNLDRDDKIARHEDIGSFFDGELGAPRTSLERYWHGRVGALDLLVAGPPCQGHSDLNNSTRRKDPRNKLYMRTIRAVEVLQPKVVLIENVPGVVHDEGRVVEKAITELTRLEYHVSDAVVHMGELGVAQYRKRHCLVATKEAPFDLQEFLDTLDEDETTVGNCLAGIEDESESRDDAFYQLSRMTAENKRRVQYLFDNEEYNLPDHLRPPCHRDKEHSYVSMYGRILWDEPAQTITSGFGSMGQGRFVHPTRQRTLTPHEAARLQGFPDFFGFSDVSGTTALREMIGNAVPPQLSMVIVGELLQIGLI